MIQISEIGLFEALNKRLCEFYFLLLTINRLKLVGYLGPILADI